MRAPKLPRPREGFFGLMAMGDQATQQIGQEVDRTSMARMLNLGDVFELVDDGFHDGTLAQEEFVDQWHELVAQCRADTGDQLNVEGNQEFFQEFFGQVALVGKQFAKELASHFWHGLAIIHVAGCEHHVEQFALIIENQVQFEAKEPAGGGFASFGQPGKDPVRVNPWVFAHRQRCGIHERDACTKTET